uniref:Uncharacterized protein n=1 Tax=Mycena chlorophos TaxID=658473 RepID=A0ABQ0LB30_MYCCL|nr:predicted protein [Mycena chlorophos]
MSLNFRLGGQRPLERAKKKHRGGRWDTSVNITCGFLSRSRLVLLSVVRLTTPTGSVGRKTDTIAYKRTEGSEGTCSVAFRTRRQRRVDGDGSTVFSPFFKYNPTFMGISPWRIGDMTKRAGWPPGPGGLVRAWKSSSARRTSVEGRVLALHPSGQRSQPQLYGQVNLRWHKSAKRIAKSRLSIIVSAKPLRNSVALHRQRP